MKASNVVAQILGGKKEVLDNVETVAEVRARLGIAATYAASVDGEPATNEQTLVDGNFVSFSEAVKGA